MTEHDRGPDDGTPTDAAAADPSAGAGDEGLPDAAPADDEASDATPAEDPVVEESPLERAERERDEYLADLQRVQAEFENFRKRTMRDGAMQRDAGVASVVTRLLDVVDDFDMAVLSVDHTDDVGALHKGLELVYSKFLDTLRSLGVARIDETAVPFDPERHQAVQSIDAAEPHAAPVVVDVMRPGYSLDGRIIRAAMVKVEK